MILGNTRSILSRSVDHYCTFLCSAFQHLQYLIIGIKIYSAHAYDMVNVDSTTEQAPQPSVLYFWECPVNWTQGVMNLVHPSHVLYTELHPQPLYVFINVSSALWTVSAPYQNTQIYLSFPAWIHTALRCVFPMSFSKLKDRRRHVLITCFCIGSSGRNPAICKRRWESSMRCARP